MATHQTHSLSVTFSPAKALAGLAILILLASLDSVLAWLTTSLCNTAGDALTVLCCFLPVAAHAAHGDALAHQGLLECLLRILLTFLPQVSAFAGAL